MMANNGPEMPSESEDTEKEQAPEDASELAFCNLRQGEYAFLRMSYNYCIFPLTNEPFSISIDSNRQFRIE